MFNTISVSFSTSRLLLLLSTLSSSALLIAAPLPNGTLLTIDPGTVNSTDCVSGSCIGFIQGSSIYWRPLLPGTDGGIIIGKNQLGGNQNTDEYSTASGEIAVAQNVVLTKKLSLATVPISGFSAGNAVTDSSLNVFNDI